ncbi:MAG: archease [Thermodesulfovibrionales bacterium]
MKTFEIIDISGDVGMRAFGATVEEAFINEAMGMYSLITDIEGIEVTQKVVIETKSDSLEGLLVSYLNELIFQFDAYGFIGKSLDINILSIEPSAFLKATVHGEEFNPEKHERKLLIKAATYHKVRIEKVSDMWEIDVIFDI